MNFPDLKTVLKMLEPGMSVSIPSEWVARIVPGDDLGKDVRVFSLAPEFECNCSRVEGAFVFTKVERI
jgi:hypothetical protein